MKYNKIERCKFSKSRRHLIELMRAYGLKNLLVREKDEEVAMLVMARSFVIKQLQKLSIALNVPETRQENWKAICDLRQTVSGRQKRLSIGDCFRISHSVRAICLWHTI